MKSNSLPDLKLKVAKLSKNSRGRRIYSKKLKNEIMDYATDNNLNKEQLSQELGISIQTLIPWFNKFSPSSKGSFQSVKIEEVGKRENKVEIRNKTTTVPEGFLLLGDVKSITEFIRGMNAIVS